MAVIVQDCAHISPSVKNEYKREKGSRTTIGWDGTGWDGLDSSGSGQRPMDGSYEHRNGPSGFIK
jgi:hypothetical protein